MSYSSTPTRRQTLTAQEQNYLPTSEELSGPWCDMDNITRKFSRRSSTLSLSKYHSSKPLQSSTINTPPHFEKIKPTLPLSAPHEAATDEEKGEITHHHPNNTSNHAHDVSHSLGLEPQQSEEPGGKVDITHPFIRSFFPILAFKFAQIQVLLGCLIIGSFSLYWGALYNREAHLVGLDMLVVNQDYYEGGIGENVVGIIQEDFQLQGTWTILNSPQQIQDFFQIDSVDNHNISELVLTQVHHRNFWSGTYIFSGATQNQIDYYQGSINDLPIAVEYTYETGRDIMSVVPFVVDTLLQVQRDFDTRYYQRIESNITRNLSTDQKANMVDSGTAMNLPYFYYLDYRPYDNNILLAPLQVGLIYLIIISFFLVTFFNDVHKILIPYLKPGWYLIYRLLFNHINFLLASIFVCSVSAIYQVDFTRAFGRGGFCVYWMTTYLALAAVGGANENMTLLIFAFDPKLVSFWLIFFVILNVAPTFSPMALTNVFYRYGYAMPIHNVNEIYKVIFMNLWKGQLGLNYGVICAWIVLNTALLPIVLVVVARKMAKKQEITHEKDMAECRAEIEAENNK